MMASRRSPGSAAKVALILLACMGGAWVGIQDDPWAPFGLQRFGRNVEGNPTQPVTTGADRSGPNGVSPIPANRKTADACGVGEVFIPQCGICAPAEPDPSIESLEFIRMPLAASGSFTVALRAFFGCNPPNTGCWGGGDRVDEIGFDCNGKLPGCFGVVPYNDPLSVTMLREPASRIRSAFYRRSIPRASIEQQEMLSQVRTIRDFVSIPGVSNMQTKLMIGDPVSAPIALTDEDTQTAIENLQTMTFFGLREYFASSVCMFFLQYGGAKSVSENPDLFAVRGRPVYNASIPIDQLDLGAIYHFEDSDLRLYDAAVTLFKERARRLNFDLVEEYPIVTMS